MANQIKWSCSW